MKKALFSGLIGKANYNYLYWARLHFGLGFALRSMARALITGHAKLPIPKGHVFIRPGTTDQKVYEEIFIDKSYAVVKSPPEFLIDAGGHIGLASAFFATSFPNAHIVVIEPDERNFEMLSLNLARFPNVMKLKAGLWGKNENLRISNPGDSPWAYNLTAGGNIEGLTIPDIMRMTGKKHIDVLKMDIEGAEIEVLETAHGWMDCVRSMLLIELHDRFRPGCTAALDAATACYGFSRSESGEYTVLTRAPFAG